ncbi:hypothetical protein [Nocardia carnea]|uniref:hypothetical protein n=1 Tax=Nocardia carnea TaxID=37328 RepID=UPI0024576B98|nr:hypothetical protein [Nocardia carnea]
MRPPVAPAWAGSVPWGGHALLGFVLGLAVLLVAGGFVLGRVSDPAGSGDPVATTFAATTAARGTTSPAAPTVAERPAAGPAAPEIGAGFVFGKVKANERGILTIHSELTRSDIVVYTDSATKLYVLIASDPAGIDVGAPLVVYGRKHADGSLTARTIAGISLHGTTK